MYIYIKNDIFENHVELPDMLSPELYDNLGDTLEDYKNGKWVLLNDKQVEFFNEHPMVSMEEIFNMKLNDSVSDEKTLESAKESIKKLIIERDNSEEVNIFFVNDFPMWLDKSTRVGLKLRFEAEKAAEFTTTSLWYNGFQFTLPIEDAVKMLCAIEIYASRCYDNTQKHLLLVDKLETIEEVEEYDYRAGYPEYLTFSIE